MFAQVLEVVLSTFPLSERCNVSIAACSRVWARSVPNMAAPLLLALPDRQGFLILEFLDNGFVAEFISGLGWIVSPD